ncbi:energy transducer TonB [Gluconobacter sp.]|uniref:energy transducer TonB n=1 Tax=Gluconobacter sp. TaxID=1876758 RepID=UPI0039EA6E0E
MGPSGQHPRRPTQPRRFRYAPLSSEHDRPTYRRPACTIDAQGRSHDCMVQEGHYTELNQTALDYVVQASYFPAIRNGHPVSSHYRMHFKFLIPQTAEP